MPEYHGTLGWWAETGTEGLYWVLDKDGLNGYEKMEILHNGDHLEIYNEDGSILWSNVIDLDFEDFRSPKAKEAQQTSLMGWWVHGLPRNMDHTQWAEIFLNNEGRFRAKLTTTRKEPSFPPMDSA